MIFDIFETCSFIMCSLCTLNPIQQIGIELPMVIDVPLHYACCENSGGVILLWSSLSFFVFPYFLGVVYIGSSPIYNNVIKKYDQLHLTIHHGANWKPVNQPTLS